MDRLRNWIKGESEKDWAEVKSQAKKKEEGILFETEIFGRFNAEIRSSELVLSHFQRLLTCNKATFQAFCRLATTHRIKYYSLKDLKQLIKDFAPFMGQIRDEIEDVRPYDQGGLRLLSRSLTPQKTTWKKNRFTTGQQRTDHQFSDAEQVRLGKITRSLADGQAKAKALRYWYLQVKTTLGDTLFTLLSKPNCFPATERIEAERLIKLLQNVFQLDVGAQNLIDELKPFFSGTKTFKQTYSRIHVLIHKGYREKYPEKSIEELGKAFSDPSLDFRLDDQEIKTIFDQYKVVQKLCKGYRVYSHSKLVHEANKIKEADQPTKEQKLQLIAIGREAIRMHFGIYPYSTQVLAVLGLLNFPEKMKGRIAQVRTGEGKSTIITMLAFYQACLGRKVDVVSSSRYLAERDYKKYRNFYSGFGISISHLCTNRPTKENFSGQLIFGTNTDFEFALIKEQLWSYNQRLLKMSPKDAIRERDVVIVDEVDNLFIDSALNSAILGIPAKIQYTWVYKPLYEFVGQLPLPPQLLLPFARSYLLEMQGGKYQTLVKDISDERLLRWLESALVALTQRKKGIDYDIRPSDDGRGPRKQIVIVDKENTGRLKIGSRWQNGVHEFLEVKHGLEVQEESVTPASISHPLYFGPYRTIFGLTGTIGTEVERKELEKIYCIDALNVPTHKPIRRKMLDPKVFKDEDTYQKAIVAEVEEMRKDHRPVLVLLETIKSTEVLAKIFEKQSIPYQLLNERQSENEDYVVAKAGAPTVVTIATNTAGRGTDIVVHPSSLWSGGLHLVFGFFPANDRVEQQGFGRAGRQGQKGSCRMILHSDQTYAELVKQRTQKIAQQSKSRERATEKERIKYGYLIPFFDRLAKWRSSLNQDFLQSVRQKLETAIAKGARSKIGSNLLPEEIDLAKAFHSEGGTHLLEQFLEAVKHRLENDILFLWGEQFYDKIGHLSDDSYEESVKKLYEACKTHLDQQLSSPRLNFYAYLQRLIGIVLN